MDYAVVLITLPATIAAADLVRELLARRLIAGANIIPDLVTFYTDGGPSLTTRETLYLCRTQPHRVAALRAALVAITGEREFEISVLAAVAGNPPYTEWINRALGVLPDAPVVEA